MSVALIGETYIRKSPVYLVSKSLARADTQY